MTAAFCCGPATPARLHRRPITHTGSRDRRETHLSDLATMVLTVQVLIIGLCFTGPVFNTQMGIVFWLLSASVYGAQRTAFLSEQQALDDEIAPRRISRLLR